MVDAAVRRRRLVAMVLVALVITGASSAVYILKTPPPPPPPPTIQGGLTIDLHTRLAVLTSTVWGINGRAEPVPSTAVSQSFSSTPAHYVRYPGGLSGERFNLTSDILYSDAG